MAAAPTQLNGKVLEVIPNARFRVLLDGRDEVLAHLSGDMRMKVIRFLPGDAVTVEVSPFDQTLGRIVKDRPAEAASIVAPTAPPERTQQQREFAEKSE